MKFVMHGSLILPPTAELIADAVFARPHQIIHRPVVYVPRLREEPKSGWKHDASYWAVHTFIMTARLDRGETLAQGFTLDELRGAQEALGVVLQSSTVLDAEPLASLEEAHQPFR